MWKFIKSAPNKENWLNSHSKEVCFIGRSNVGKSTLINAITKISKLAVTSKTPGRTQLVNFFQEGKKMIVDLPGYGYAKMSKERKAKMVAMIEQYFMERNQIVKVFLLVDAKIGPTKDDMLMIDFLKSVDLSVIVVATKADKAKQTEISKTQKKLKDFSDDFIIVSSLKGKNIENLRKIIEAQF